jgi:hypothetical protein
MSKGQPASSIPHPLIADARILNANINGIHVRRSPRCILAILPSIDSQKPRECGLLQSYEIEVTIHSETRNRHAHPILDSGEDAESFHET